MGFSLNIGFNSRLVRLVDQSSVPARTCQSRFNSRLVRLVAKGMNLFIDPECFNSRLVRLVGGGGAPL